MRKHLSFAASILFCISLLAAAQDTAPVQEWTNGTIQEVDTSAMSFTIGEAPKLRRIQYTDQTLFFLERPDEKPELKSGDTVQVFGKVWFTGVGIETLTFRLFKMKEGEKGPENEITKKSVTGTFKQEGDQMWIIVQTEEGERTIAMAPEPLEPQANRVMEKVPAMEALQTDRVALIKCVPQGEGFLASEVQVKFAKAPASAPVAVDAE